MEQTQVPIFAQLKAESAGLAGETMSFGDLVKHAIAALKWQGRSEVVCGPITTGGYGDVGLNTLLFNHAIELLQLEGRPMFNQIPYEFQLARLENEWKAQNGRQAYCAPILTEFYLPIFESGLIVRGWFLPGWERSKGASWEHEVLVRLGCDIRYLGPRWMYELNARNI